MFVFGKTSKRRLEDAAKAVQGIMQEAIETAPFDFTILDVFRDKARQNEAFNAKRSTKQWSESIHNVLPVWAVDVARFYKTNPHIRWDNFIDFKVLFDHIKKVAKKHGYEAIWGGDWDGDGDTYEHSFIDMPHIQFRKIKKSGGKKDE
jgi:hypothetical protein